MHQSLTRLPESLEFKIGVLQITIHNHQVMYAGLLSAVIHIVLESKHDSQVLCQFEKYGISFESVVEYCSEELECDAKVLARIICLNYYENKNRYDPSQTDLLKIQMYSASEAGRKMADQHIDKIRSCDNWEDLYYKTHEISELCKKTNDEIFNEVPR